MAKLTDVAKLAQCSVTTVSRVINNYGYISDRTRQKVHQAMKELNYQPNSLARSLQGKKTKLVGVIFPSIANPFFGELVAEIEKQLFSSGYKTILCNAGNDKEKERTYLQMLMANQVDGIIAGAHNLGIDEYQKTGLPIISFDRQLSDNIPIVTADNYQGGCLATQELYDNGARHIYFVGNPVLDGHPTQRRLEGYKETIEKLGLTQHIHPVIFGETPELKEMAIKDLLQFHKVDGIVASDDLTAILVLNIAKKLGIKVPNDLKVIGFDGTDYIQTYHPELSTIVQPLGAIAQLLVKLLEERIADPDKTLETSTYKLPVKILKRESSSNN
ncbi:LacI family sucrose operon transcriptional repressor [Lactobacillus colini]|uniref:LacI family sucrose operon transcriptional repressor n=1 Tax=Lactobacillus colini TaxID=1819254 RepID=A0ABS4MGJ6_9LACO|nr:LacI family DNA-binding transcriptional regulator [Lactobacillus colini]MBP2058824.1 LacI family sucrose operon transcriptional repressor [Lactobacillus colini]